MEILKFGDNPSPNRSNNNQRKPAAMIVAGVLVAMMGMSTTLAGTITIGTNNRIEFGQGLVTTAACDSSITITPSSSFNATTDTFTVTSLKISDVNGYNVDSNQMCLGKWFIIKAYSGSTQLNFRNSVDTATATSIQFKIPGTGLSDSSTANSSWSMSSDSTVKPVFSGHLLTFADQSGWTDSVGQITIGNFILAPSVTKITVESADASQ